MNRDRSDDNVSYDDLDSNVRELVRELNQFPDLHTLGSCGGHPERITAVSAPEGRWWVTLHPDWTDDGRISLEFVAWAVRDLARANHLLFLEAFACPPWLNEPGEGLTFQLTGIDVDPQDVADFLAKWRVERFISAAELAELEEEG
jgi:hypothetical protein